LGASVRHLEPERLLQRGIAVCNTADAVALGVAEHCLMVSLAGLRQLTRHDSAMRRGEWGLHAKPRGAPTSRGDSKRSPVRALAGRLPVPLAMKKRLYRSISSMRAVVPRPAAARHPEMGSWNESDLHGQVVGLLGWGHVARHFTRLLKTFECRVLVWTESATPDELAAAGAHPASLSEILGSAKVISVHRGLTEHTRGFLDAHRLSEIRSGSVIVNTARGPLIDEQALVARLLDGDVIAALDVFDEEPLPRKHPLRELPNVILTPHNASNTAQEERRMGSQALDYVIGWAQGTSVPAIDVAQLDRMT
jgi:phosphoglycerate dehydrogenase-like enzyme